MAPIPVLCVDDSPDLSEVLCRVINAADGMNVVGRLAEADNLVEEVRRTCPRVVVIDLTMNGKDPLDAVRDLSQAFPDVRIIAFSAPVSGVSSRG